MSLDRVILFILLFEYGALATFYLCAKEPNKAMYWAGAFLLNVAIMKGLQ